MENKPLDSHINIGINTEETASRHAKEASEQINKEKLEAAARLAGWFAHKINNPLGTISGNAQLLARRLERDISDPDMLAAYMRYVDTIRSQVERCAQITSELLDFTRPRDVEIHDVDLATAAQEAVELVSFGRSKCNISIITDGSPVIVKTDRELIVRVIYEVLSNAINAIPEDGAVTLEFETANDNAVRIIIKDNGTGIDGHALQRIFEPFFSTRDKSRGLGLTRSLAFIRQLGGNIEVVETGPDGTVMIITLPAGGP